MTDWLKPLQLKMYLRAREVELGAILIAKKFGTEEEKIKFITDHITETSEQIFIHYSDTEDPDVQKVLGDLRCVIDSFKKTEKEIDNGKES